jgi:hypothetical protein
MYRFNTSFFSLILSLIHLGFGDLVPMQRNDYGNVSWLYTLFCIMFILTGLTIVASSGNLLILRFVEANTKRCQNERIEIEEQHRQKVRIIGDVISSNGRFFTLEDDEDTPSLPAPMSIQRLTMEHSSSDLSLCSCRGQTLCIPISCKKKFKRKQHNMLNNKNSKQSIIKSEVIVSRTLKEKILDTLQTKTENNVLQRSYLQLDKIQKRISI